MKKVWPRHKPDCDAIVAATKYFESSGVMDSSSVSCMISVDDMLRLDDRGIAIYRKYGVDELPDSTSTVDTDKKLALFLEVLRENDTCRSVNRGLPLPEILILNRYFNGMYDRAKKIFTASQFAQLDAQIKAVLRPLNLIMLQKF
ncbi:unnamed protein product [Phytophthora lilii]|uniref:Unnamed protein product n=1 Tax=Phytophthora lilii TaxID=2077276 RepID=A0A9W6TIX7_9STRA|nr:unnamed protein product [Phytophthora lilii]